MLKLRFSKIVTATVVAGLVVCNSLVPAFAQSSDRDAPTVLTTNVLTGSGIEGQDRIYYYRFTAKPGKMKITFDLDAGSTNGNGIVSEISLQTPEARQIDSLSGYASPGNPSRTVKTLNFPEETPVILMLKLTGGMTAGYTYKVKIDGSWVEL